MATLNPGEVKPISRSILEMSSHAYARIVARKHGIAVLPDLISAIELMTDEELSSFQTVVRDLAHLPPA
jgi:hypothetical protein